MFGASELFTLNSKIRILREGRENTGDSKAVQESKVRSKVSLRVACFCQNKLSHNATSTCDHVPCSAVFLCLACKNYWKALNVLDKPYHGLS